MFYKVDTTRFTLREYFWGTPVLLWPILLPVLLALKLLRVRLPNSGIIPDSLDPFLVNPTGIPEEVRAKMQPLEDQLGECGFIDPIYILISDPYGSRRGCSATYRHPSGTAFAQISYRQELARRPPKEVLQSVIITAFNDGTFLETTSGRRQMLSPPECQVQRAVGASVPDLWRLHRERLAIGSLGKTITPANSREEAFALLKANWAAELDFHVRRGVFVPRNETEQKSVEGVMAVTGDENERKFAAVYAEIERLANRKASWSSGIIVLLITLGLFLAMGKRGVSWKPLALIVGVLFFHELGHFAAMSAFGYRNLRMFFIPFLGAAVTGVNYNVPGWKKALVSLAGPAPGIVLGAILAVVGSYNNWPAMLFAAILLLGINAFNLLPIMPMDGGQLMHAVLFCRHPALDAAFRAIAAGLLLLTGLRGVRVLPILGFFMLMGLPMTYRVGSVVRRLRRRGFDATSNDGITIPRETARLIHEEFQGAMPAGMTAKASAAWTLQAFELLNARSPGWLASLALIGLQGLFFFAAAAVLMGIVSNRI